MGKGRDLQPRKRRSKLTAKEREKLAADRAKTKEQKEQRIRLEQEKKAEKANPKSTFFLKPAEKAAVIAEKKAGDAAESNGESEEETIYYDTVDCPPNTLLTGDFFEAKMSDLDEDEDDSSTSEEGIMKKLATKLVQRLQDELRVQSRGASRPVLAHDEKWLLEFLRLNGFWVRQSHAKYLYEKLFKKKFNRDDQYYYRDIRVWLPDEQYKCPLTCPFCKESATARHSLPTSHPIRRITDIDTSYWLLSAEYKCKGACDGRKFMATNNECVKSQPAHVSPLAIRRMQGMVDVCFEIRRCGSRRNPSSATLRRAITPIHLDVTSTTIW